MSTRPMRATRPGSRVMPAFDMEIIAHKISDATRMLARVTEAISAYLLFAGGRLNSLMPTAQFDVLENLDKPAMPVGGKSESYTLWERLGTERDRYFDGVDVDLTPAKGNLA